MQVHPSRLGGVHLVGTKRFSDERGSFARLFCNPSLREVLGARTIVQINHSHTKRTGAIRGLHFQRAPQAEMKLVRCLRGRVWDVAVDLRRGSDTFLQWTAVELSAENGDMIVIPEGFAHGFQALTEDCELLYLHTAAYTPSVEGGIRYDEPRIAVAWPAPPTELSARDSGFAYLTDKFQGMDL
jgi:dTDP-4-dehydrorhamnose 3,5-epimerase